jgi:O-antigen ligase
MSAAASLAVGHRPDRRAAAVVAAGLLAATLAGLLLAAKPVAGVGLVAALVFVALAAASPVLALSSWVTLTFLSGIPGTHGAGSNYALLVVLIVWIGALLSRRTTAADLLRGHPVQAASVAGLVLWAGVTLIWAPQPGIAGATLRNLAICAAVFAMAATLALELRHVRWLALGFVVGTTLSVLVGAATGGLQPSDAFDVSTVDSARLSGAGHDANYLAAAIVPAIVLAAGLAAARGRPLLRLALAGAVLIMGVGLAATESRGGFLAAGITCVGALVLLRGQRARVAALLVVLVLAIGAWFSVSPGSWARVTSVSDGGSGRTDIWHVAAQIARDHPLAGVGLGQFPAVSPSYLNRPGPVTRGDLLIGRRIVVHNLYLQAWVELGAIGVLLYLTIAGASLRAGWQAARRFERDGDTEHTALARTTVLALAGALTASIFLSNIDDRRTWVLLALGPALLTLTEISRRPTRGAWRA